jgi:hypothetical protein
MTEFVVGVVSSLVASAVIVMATWFFSERIRGWAASVVSRVTGLGILTTYPTQAAANAEMGRELARARWVKVFTGRGNELTRESFETVWQQVGRRISRVQILLPDPATVTLPDSWLARREAEVAIVDDAFRGGILASQIATNVAYLGRKLNSHQGSELRLYDFPHLCRLIVTDRVAFMTLYRDAEHGRNSPCLLVRRPGLLYDFALRVFDLAWEASSQVPHASSAPP